MSPNIKHASNGSPSLAEIDRSSTEPWKKFEQTNYPLCTKWYIPKDTQKTESAVSSLLPKEHIEIRNESYYKLNNCKLRGKFFQLSLTDPFTQPFMAIAVIVAEIGMAIINGILVIVTCDWRQLLECARLIMHACVIPFALIALEAIAILGIITPHYARHYYTKIEGFIYRKFIPEQGLFFRFTSNVFGPVKNVNAYQLHLEQQAARKGGSGFCYFIKQYCKNADKTASLVPSSYALAAEITSFMDQRTDKDGPMRILEVGAGSGAFTTEILRKLRPNDQFDVIEFDEGFCNILKELCAKKPHVTVHHQSILDFNAEKYDLIISGLPLHAMNSSTFVNDVYAKFLSLAKENAAISQFEYIALPKIGSWFFCGERKKKHLEILKAKKQFMQSHSTTIAPVYWNLPPAQVLHCRVTSPKK